MICLLTNDPAIAQVDILKKAVEHTNQCFNMSYSQIARQKNPFSGDWVSLNVKTSVSYDRAIGKDIYNTEESRGFQNVYNGSTEMDLDLNDKTYTLNKDATDDNYRTPYYWIRLIKRKLTASPKEIKSLPDTTINKIVCFHVKMTIADTIANREIYDLYFNKSTYLPVRIVQLMEGKFGKGDFTSDNVALMINEDTYSDYHLNAASFDDIKAFIIPIDFQPEKKTKPLAIGQKAPTWILKDLQGNTWSDEKLKGKIVIMDFSFNECAACALSIPLLKKISDQYRSANVEVISVNTSNTKASVIAFDQKNGIKYPVLLNGAAVSKNFQVSAFPFFYVINKQGNIAASFEGYGNELENELTQQIEKLH
ncbi:MAG TPA: TlpA disulfide reductase family protein [Candidatus Babeliaceae bacterium]|nr:TlpA disulfide reductase family protein [Candidatus Babeliaceae bacterium]